MLFILEILAESIATVALWFFLKNRYQKNPNFIVVGFVAIAIVIGTVLFNGWNQVPQNYQGVESSFGKLHDEKTHHSGWAFIKPWRKMVLFSSKLHNVHPENNADHAMHIFSSDGVPLKASVNFSVIATDHHVARVIDGVGPTMDEVVRTLFAPCAEAAVSNSGGSIVAHDIWNWTNDGEARKRLESVVLENFLEEIVKRLRMIPQFDGLDDAELSEVFHVGAQLSSVTPGNQVEDALSANAATEQLKNNQQNLKSLAEAEKETMEARGTALRAFIEALGPDVSLADVAAYNLAGTLELARQKDQLPQQLSWQVGGSQTNQ